MANAEQLATQFKELFLQKHYQKCLQLLPTLKLELAKHNLLIPNLKNPNTREGDLLITRSILEAGALLALYASDLNKFEKLIIELKPFYEIHTAFFQENKSANLNKLYSLYLLLLLTKGELSEFYTEVLKLKQIIVDIEQDEFCKYPINLEKSLMDGSYDKVWNLINQNNSIPEFKHFTNELIHTLRLEISECLLVTYKTLSVQQAKLLLFFEFEEQLLEFINEEYSNTWLVKSGHIYPTAQDRIVEKEQEDEEESSTNQFIIKSALQYAKDMETIV